MKFFKSFFWKSTSSFRNVEKLHFFWKPIFSILNILGEKYYKKWSLLRGGGGEVRKSNLGNQSTIIFLTNIFFKPLVFFYTFSTIIFFKLKIFEYFLTNSIYFSQLFNPKPRTRFFQPNLTFTPNLKHFFS